MAFVEEIQFLVGEFPSQKATNIEDVANVMIL